MMAQPFSLPSHTCAFPPFLDILTELNFDIFLQNIQNTALTQPHTMLQTITNPDGSFSIIQIDPGDIGAQFVTLSDGTQAQIVQAVRIALFICLHGCCFLLKHRFDSGFVVIDYCSWVATEMGHWKDRNSSRSIKTSLSRNVSK